MARYFVPVTTLVIVALLNMACATVDQLLLRPSLNHQPTLSRSLLNKAISYRGDDSRFRKVIDKLIDGQPVKYAVVGSSVATGRGSSFMDGAWVHLIHKWLELTYSPCADLRPGANFQMTDPGYIASHHMCPQSTITYIDLAVYASSPLYGEKCMASKIPQDVDLVLVEFGINDFYYTQEMMEICKDPAYQMSTTERRALERLYRKVLNLPSKPALLLFEPYSWNRLSNNNQHFGPLPEDFHVIFAQYYGNIQVISARNALYQKIKEIGAASLPLMNWFEVDTIHPKDEGHKMYADLVIHLFQTYTREQIMARREAMNPLGKVMPQVVDAGPLGGFEPPLQEPLIPHNYEHAGGFCAMGDEFKPKVVTSMGWDFVDEGFPLPNGLPHHKYGYVSKVPGSKLTMMIDTSLGGFANLAEGVQVLVAHLKSYEHMGKARISCVAGCTCLPATMDGHTMNHASVTSFASITVSPSPQCMLEVENLFESSSGEFKFKVIGVAVHDKAIDKSQFFFGGDHDDYADNKAG